MEPSLVEKLNNLMKHEASISASNLKLAHSIVLLITIAVVVSLNDL